MLKEASAFVATVICLKISIYVFDEFAGFELDYTLSVASVALLFALRANMRGI